jgi:hypothetical protein
MQEHFGFRDKRLQVGGGFGIGQDIVQDILGLLAQIHNFR